MTTEPPTPAVHGRIRRVAANARYDRASVERVLDRGQLAHIAFIHDGRPYCIPTLYARVGSSVLIHGSSASRMIRVLRGGAPACLTVSVLDALVLARSAFETGANYDSVVLHGSFSAVPETRKLEALECFMESLLPGRWASVRHPTRQELKATKVLELSLEDAAVKTKSGGPDDDHSRDAELDVWAGVVPLVHGYGPPEPAPGLRPGIPLPEHVRRLAGDGAATDEGAHKADRRSPRDQLPAPHHPQPDRRTR
jgi:nitroimidazol reductase NimA-like FMN-containing flavoprotein (pyridoxamine 5'-phosphate oxidase superfamily)